MDRPRGSDSAKATGWAGGQLLLEATSPLRTPLTSAASGGAQSTQPAGCPYPPWASGSWLPHCFLTFGLLLALTQLPPAASGRSTVHTSRAAFLPSVPSWVLPPHRSL